MAKQTFTKQARFRYFSSLAARLERQGHYKEASNTWNQAYKIASSEENRQWCLHRSEWCERLTDHPF